MFSEELFDIILNLGKSWKVSKVVANLKIQEVDVFVEYIGDKADNPSTNAVCPIYDHAPIRRRRHLNTMQYKTFINCCVPGIKDSTGKVKTIKVPWADEYERHTYLFERVAIDILQSTKNQTKTAQLLRCGFNVINSIMHNSVARGLNKRPKDHCFEHISIDEKSFKHGHSYVTVVSDPLTGVVIEVAENRDYSACRKILNEIVKPGNKVKTASMDMWKPYINATKDIIPNAEIVHDKFHLVKMMNDAVDKVRKREVKQHEALRNTKYLFLKNPGNQTEKQRIKFETITSVNYEVSRAWRVKENFRAIFGCKSIKEASILLNKKSAKSLTSLIFVSGNCLILLIVFSIKSCLFKVKIFTNLIIGCIHSQITPISFPSKNIPPFHSFGKFTIFDRLKRIDEDH